MSKTQITAKKTGNVIQKHKFYDDGRENEDDIQGSFDYDLMDKTMKNILQKHKINDDGGVQNPFDHALIRPDTYIGSIKTIDVFVYIYDDESVKWVLIPFNEGLFNILREIGSNCIDNKFRSEEHKMVMDSIKISWNSDTKVLCFWNNGYYISAELKDYKFKNYRKGTADTEKMYPIECFFGEFLAGTNFNDDQVRKTSGRNGMGSKATNVWSTSFIVEHYDPKVGKKIIQKYSENATVRTKPKLSAHKGKNGWTSISFVPDFDRFNYDIEENESNFINMLRMYAVEIAAVSKVNVDLTINETTKVYSIKSFDKFARLFYPNKTANKMTSITLPNDDECIIIESYDVDLIDMLPDTLETCNHFAYVNGLKTKDGGVHVNAWRDGIIPAFVKLFNARKAMKGKTAVKTTAKDVYPYLSFFIRTEMDKPSFNTQTKDKLNGPVYKLYSEGQTKISAELKETIDKSVNEMMKWGFVKHLEEKLTTKILGKQHLEKRIALGDKAKDANWAGTGVGKNPKECELKITEGLSAKAMVVRGRSSVKNGTNAIGIFAIQGKFLNVRNSVLAKALKNKEVKGLMQILGLRIGVDYSVDENFKTLRYQKSIGLVADADDDGLHIRGLLINFFMTFWPKLLKRTGYLDSLSTGVVKVTFINKKLEDKLFYSVMDYDKWYKNHASDDKIKESKYLKGLGSINKADVPGYFINPKTITYFVEGDEAEYMKLGFDGCNTDWRKDWILKGLVKSNGITFNQEECDILGIDHVKYLKEQPEEDYTYVYEGELGISTFVYTQLVIYHSTTLKRSLPSLMDGFKESQRKIFYAIRQKNYQKTTNLEKVMGSVKDITGYHHGGASLLGAIVRMSTYFPGSNNIAYLIDDGEFGTRSGGGNDFAQPRYLHTALNKRISDAICNRSDDHLYKILMSDDDPAEFEEFWPVVCMLLINGSDGIASGWSSTIPNFNPTDIAKWQLAWLNNKHKSCNELVPWYRGIKNPINRIKSTKTGVADRWTSEGTLFECGKGCTQMCGKQKCKGEKGWWHITELPVGLWTDDFLEYLEYLTTCIPPDSHPTWKKLETRRINDHRDFSSADLVHFMIKPSNSGGGWDPCMDSTLKNMKISKNLSNLVAIDSNGYPTRYTSPEHLLESWCEERLKGYSKRKAYLIKLYKHNILVASNKYIFIEAVVKKTLNMNQSKQDLDKCLLELKINKLTVDLASDQEPSYSYLLGMKMQSMTIEKMTKLKLKLNSAESLLEQILPINVKDMWREDIYKFQKEWEIYTNENIFS